MIPLHRYLALVAVVSVVALAVTLGLRPDPTERAAVAANRTEANPWAAVPPTTERPLRLDAPVAAVAREVAAHEAERASRSRRDVGGGVGGGGGGSNADVWACIRKYENSGSYTSHKDGAYQIIPSTWASLPQSAHYSTPASAPPAVQDQAARDLQARSGWSQWTTAGRCGVG